MSTRIEWVQNQDGTQGVTWNPVTGCTKVSEGCRNCYAERMARVGKKRPGRRLDGVEWNEMPRRQKRENQTF